MKPIRKASIAKTAFVLEEQAYVMLENYIDSLEKHFAGNPTGKEIMEEIEGRIAELLLEKSGGAEYVVTESAVREVMTTLGSVADISTEDGSAEGSYETDAGETANGENNCNDSDGRPGNTASNETAEGKLRKAKRLYRDPDKRVLGGVCSGIAAYLNWDPVLVRAIGILLFIFMTLPSGGHGIFVAPLLYVILWIIIPKARTVEDKYRMRGESNTIDSILKNIGNNAEEIGRTAEKYGKENARHFRGIARSLQFITGVIFIIVSVACLVLAAVLIFGGSALIPVNPLSLIYAVTGTGGTLLGIATAGAIGIPVIGILYCGILMCTGMRSPKWRPELVMLLLWIFSLGVLGWFTGRSILQLGSAERQYRSVSSVPTPGRGISIIMEQATPGYDYIYIEADRKEYRLVTIDDGIPGIYPEVNLRRSANVSDVVIEFSSFSLPGKVPGTEFGSFSNDTLRLAPIRIEKGRKISELDCEVWITVPFDYKVEVISPGHHDFNSRQRYTNIPILRHRYLDIDLDDLIPDIDDLF